MRVEVLEKTLNAVYTKTGQKVSRGVGRSSWSSPLRHAESHLRSAFHRKGLKIAYLSAYAPQTHHNNEPDVIGTLRKSQIGVGMLVELFQIFGIKITPINLKMKFCSK